MDVRLLHDIPGAGCKSIEHIAHAHAQSRPGFSFTAKDVLHARAGIRVEVDQRTRAKIAKDFSRGAPQESKEVTESRLPG